MLFCTHSAQANFRVLPVSAVYVDTEVYCGHAVFTGLTHGCNRRQQYCQKSLRVSVDEVMIPTSNGIVAPVVIVLFRFIPNLVSLRTEKRKLACPFFSLVLICVQPTYSAHGQKFKFKKMWGRKGFKIWGFPNFSEKTNGFYVGSTIWNVRVVQLLLNNVITV